MTVSVGDRVSLAARATGIVPVRQPGPAIGHAHVDPPHRDVLRDAWPYTILVLRRLSDHMEQYGYRYDVRTILAVDLTSICFWQRWTLWLIPGGYIASQKMPERPNGARVSSNSI